jgi:hypothetical protein
MIDVLMALNAVGVFGFLTRAHLERQLAIEVVAADRAAEIEACLRQCAPAAHLDPQSGAYASAFSGLGGTGW